MMKRLITMLLCAAVALCAAGALADSWEGSVTVLESIPVTAPADGVLERLSLETGARAEEGVTAGSVRTDKVFAPFDGTVASLGAEAGENVSGTVLEISPVSLYTVTCTVTDAAQTPENALIHAGETLYVRCTADGSHRAEAVVISVSGAEFTAETTAGELYVGEAVWLYRNAECTTAGRVGKGTVTAHDPLAVTADGVIDQIRVQPGDRVERGQWLFSISSSGNREVLLPAAGIVTDVKAAAGDQVEEGQELAEIAVSTAIRAEVAADEAALFRKGQAWSYIRGDDPHETLRPCRVSRVLTDAEDASAVVEFIPEDETLLPVGMNVTITEAQE